jgi:hypothetical protein
MRVRRGGQQAEVVQLLPQPRGIVRRQVSYCAQRRWLAIYLQYETPPQPSLCGKYVELPACEV